ncbi:MAG: hypothetical protein KDK39_20240 [Leptospiraceae bacterium]|nr:hypothetical protein [Leptospiraceae bacterium]
MKLVPLPLNIIAASTWSLHYKLALSLFALSALFIMPIACTSYEGLTKKQYNSTSLRPYRTRRSEVVAKWGEPYSTYIQTVRGKEYTYDEYPSQDDSFRWAQWIPFVNYFYLLLAVENSLQDNFKVTLTYYNGVLQKKTYQSIRN